MFMLQLADCSWRVFREHRVQTSHMGKALATWFAWHFQIGQGRKSQGGSVTPRT